MKIAILIHVHKDAEQTKRLVSHLQHANVDVYINIDKKTDRNNFTNLIPNAIYIKKSVDVVWGQFSQVQQILNSFEEILSSGVSYSHVLFISGQDYPVVNIETIVSFLKQSENKSFIDYHLVSPLKDDSWSRTIHNRFEYWYFLPKTDIRTNRLVKKLIKLSGYKRKYPTKDIYYGSCWFTLHLDAIKYIFQYIRENSQLIKFFTHTGCADELFFQSILLNSPLKNLMINKTYRYIDWDDKGKSPKDLTTSDFNRIKSSNAWFARKINPKVDSSIVDLLDTLNTNK